MKVYIAAPFFNTMQIERMQRVLDVVRGCGFEVFAPYEYLVLKPDATQEERKKIFDKNIEEIMKADLVVSVTNDKDIGSLYETGYASALGKNIIGYAEGLQGQFNVMLAQAMIGVATNEVELRDLFLNLNKIVEENKKYEGLIE